MGLGGECSTWKFILYYTRYVFGRRLKIAVKLDG
jgi:hypothetical protein